MITQSYQISKIVFDDKETVNFQEAGYDCRFFPWNKWRALVIVTSSKRFYRGIAYPGELANTTSKLHRIEYAIVAANGFQCAKVQYFEHVFKNPHFVVVDEDLLFIESKLKTPLFTTRRLSRLTGLKTDVMGLQFAH